LESFAELLVVEVDLRRRGLDDDLPFDFGEEVKKSRGGVEDIVSSI